jgi:hypothetical protein
VHGGEGTVGGHAYLLGRDHLDCLPEPPGDLLRAFHLQVLDVDDSHPEIFVVPPTSAKSWLAIWMWIWSQSSAKAHGKGGLP